jgi:hypothetical protein
VVCVCVCVCVQDEFDSVVRSSLLAGYEDVTCGSMVKLTHYTSKAKLHSHEVAYATGSSQQVRRRHCRCRVGRAKRTHCDEWDGRRV